MPELLDAVKEDVLVGLSQQPCNEATTAITTTRRTQEALKVTREAHRGIREVRRGTQEAPTRHS